jgi:hypothetical protein
VEIGDSMGNGKKGSGVFVACNTNDTNLEENSGIDDEKYVIINEGGHTRWSCHLCY